MDARLLELQRVVANEQGLRANRPRRAAGVQLQAQRAVRGRQGLQRRPAGHQPAAPVFAFVSLAILQQLGIQTHAGVDDEGTGLVRADDAAGLHRLDPGLEQGADGGFGVLRNAVRAAEIVKSALRDHAHGAAGDQRGLGHCVDGAVTPGGNRRAAVLPRQLHSTLHRVAQSAELVDHQHLMQAARTLQPYFDDGPFGSCVVMART